MQSVAQSCHLLLDKEMLQGLRDTLILELGALFTSGQLPVGLWELHFPFRSFKVL
jgi:hypothetical protein